MFRYSMKMMLSVPEELLMRCVFDFFKLSFVGLFRWSRLRDCAGLPTASNCWKEERDSALFLWLYFFIEKLYMLTLHYLSLILSYHRNASYRIIFCCDSFFFFWVVDGWVVNCPCSINIFWKMLTWLIGVQCMYQCPIVSFYRTHQEYFGTTIV